MRLRRVKEPFDHPDYIFELKHDGFRAVAYLQCQPVQLAVEQAQSERSNLSVGADVHADQEPTAGAGHERRQALEVECLAASRRRSELLELLDRLKPSIEELTTAVEQEVNKRPEALRLMTHPGVGPITALAFVLIIGTPERFCSWQADRHVCGDDSD